RPADRPAAGAGEANPRRGVDPLAAARLLDLATDPLSPFPLAAELDEGVPRRMRMRLRMLIQLVAVVVIVTCLMLVRRLAEAVRERDPALQPVAQPRVLGAAPRELIKRAGADAERTGPGSRGGT